MRKVAFVALLFLLGLAFLSGCLPQEDKTDSFTEWVNFPPISYTTIDKQYESEINSALFNNDEEKCNDVLDEERTRVSINSFVVCKNLLVKQKAFQEKNY